MRRFWQGRRRALHVAHLPVNALDDVVVREQVRDDTVLGGFERRRGLEARGQLQETLSQREGQVDGVTVLCPSRWHSCAGQLAHVGHGLVHIFA